MNHKSWPLSAGRSWALVFAFLALAGCTSAFAPPSGSNHPASADAAAAAAPPTIMPEMNNRAPMTGAHDHGMTSSQSIGTAPPAMSMPGAADAMQEEHGHGAASHNEMEAPSEQIARLPDGPDHDHAPADSNIDRVIEVRAVDVDFEPKTISVHAGETIRFIVTNVGAIDHEFVIGDEATQVAHAEEMAAMGSAMDHSHSNAMVLKPGETKEMVWTFEAGQNLQFACHVPGHYKAGMWGTFDVHR